MARILLINKFYDPRGGDCIAVLTLEKLLKQHGHEVAIFASIHPENISSPWSSYFPNEINFSSPGIKNKLKAASRLFYSKEVKNNFLKLLSDFKPDIVHAHNIHSYLSPYVIKIAAHKGIKTVWTLHDYKLICPSYACLRDGKPCELCFNNKLPVIQYKCMKGDMKASISAYLEAEVWNQKILERYTDTFISPSQFLKSKMIAGGFHGDKIEVLSNFFSQQKDLPAVQKGDYYCYVGRLSYEKGIDSLIRAAQQLPYPLKIAGGGERLEEYQTLFQNSHIEFLGHLPNDKVLQLIRQARFSVVPSVCYDNNPFSIIESLCMGTPVIGSDIGGIPELIQPEKNGFLFPPHNTEILKEQISKAFTTFVNPFDFNTLANDARTRFDSERHYAELMRIYGLTN